MYIQWVEWYTSGLSNFKSTAGRKLSVGPPGRPQFSSQPLYISTTVEGREGKYHKLSIIESKCYDLEFLSLLFHTFNKLILGLFYFGSLASRMKLPRGPHAACGQVGKPWYT